MDKERTISRPTFNNNTIATLNGLVDVLYSEWKKILHYRLPYLLQETTCDVTSLYKLRCLVDRLRSGGTRRRGIQHEEQTAIVQYFKRFFHDLERLRDLKCYFHERIYACLYEHYYKPDSEHSGSPTSTIYPDGRSGSGRPLATVLDQSDNDAPFSMEGRPLSEIVQQLWTLNRDPVVQFYSVDSSTKCSQRLHNTSSWS